MQTNQVFKPSWLLRLIKNIEKPLVFTVHLLFCTFTKFVADEVKNGSKNRSKWSPKHAKIVFEVAFQTISKNDTKNYPKMVPKWSRKWSQNRPQIGQKMFIETTKTHTHSEPLSVYVSGSFWAPFLVHFGFIFEPFLNHVYCQAEVFWLDFEALQSFVFVLRSFRSMPNQVSHALGFKNSIF